jgi:hypothetical protein
MTAKEALRERIELLSEEEAEELLHQMDWDSTATETLTAEELAEMLAAEADMDAGEFVMLEDVLKRLEP